MTMKKVYSCDICREKISNPLNLLGVNFSGLKNFTLSGYATTDGQHICFGCAKQLKHHLSKIEDCDLEMR